MLRVYSCWEANKAVLRTANVTWLVFRLSYVICCQAPDKVGMCCMLVQLEADGRIMRSVYKGPGATTLPKMAQVRKHVARAQHDAAEHGLTSTQPTMVLNTLADRGWRPWSRLLCQT